MLIAADGIEHKLRIVGFDDLIVLFQYLVDKARNAVAVAVFDTDRFHASLQKISFRLT